MSLPLPLDGAGLVRGDALRLPLRHESVDLVVTSPPYFALRSYQDGGEHYGGQIGSEATPLAFLEALWAVTAECKRVLKPGGSIFVNLGDKYAGSGGHNNGGLTGATSSLGGSKTARDATRVQQASRRNAPDRYNQNSDGISAKSLMLLPERYRIGCVDHLGLIARAVIIWDKPNGLPESVQDRVRRSHEDWVHLTKQGRYYAAVDEIREAYTDQPKRSGAGWLERTEGNVLGRASDPHGGLRDQTPNPLGKLPGSVWRIATEPLQVPDWVGVDHFAAFPSSWPRDLILGWSPAGGVVLDPFVGTGTTVAAARALGRFGVGVDLSADYLRLAHWRVFDDDGLYEKVRGRKPQREKTKPVDPTAQTLQF